MPTMFKHELPTRAESRKAQKAAMATNWREVCRAVTARDKSSCRACGRRCSPGAADMLAAGHHHHIEYRSKGGMDTTENVCLLCAECHGAVHAQKLSIEGNADVAVTISRRDADGRWFVARQETGVREFHHD